MVEHTIENNQVSIAPMYQHFFGLRVFLFAFYYNQPLNFGKWVIPLNDIPLEDSRAFDFDNLCTRYFGSFLLLFLKSII